MEAFRCYYCPYKTDSFEQIIGHCSVLHEEKLLKYRKLVLDDLTGICRYQTQTHEGVVPLKIKESGKILGFKPEFQTILSISIFMSILILCSDELSMKIFS